MRKFTLRASAPAVLAAILTQACTASTAPSANRRVHSILEPLDSTGRVVVVPDSVHAAVPFVVTVGTVGSPCVGLDSAAIQPTADGVEIIPYDAVPTTLTNCPQEVYLQPRHFKVAVPGPVIGIVRVVGRVLHDGTSTLGETVAVVRVVP